MTKRVLLSVLGEDRPGLVESIADIVRHYEGNWLESRLSHLAGKFSGLITVEIKQDAYTHLVSRLEELHKDGLSIRIEEINADSADTREIYRIELVGNDKPGIVRDIARVMAMDGVNVEEIRTHRGSAAWSGGDIFEATIQVSLPSGLDPDKLRGDLENLANDLMVDIKFQKH